MEFNTMVQVGGPLPDTLKVLMKRGEFSRLSADTIRDLAISWQCADVDRSYAGLAEWAEFFERVGLILGLYDEFKENGII